VLYHWRQIPGSTSLLFAEKDYAWEAGRKALEETLGKDLAEFRVETGKLPGTYRPVYPVRGEPLISVIIPFRDRPHLLDQCLQALLDHSGWQHLEVIGVDNQSQEQATRECMARWMEADPRIRFVGYDAAFNFAAICNYGAKSARGDYLMFLNNDVVINQDGSVRELLQYACHPGIGAVGGRLTYPDGTIQHAGIVVGIGGSAGHAFKGFSAELPGYFGRLQVASNVSAVTAAMLMLHRGRFEAAGGFDAERFAIALNDVDLCLELLRLGYRNVITPWAGGVHHESASRGSDLDAASRQRLESETRQFREKWQEFLASGDPSYHPALTLESEDYRIDLA
jgi:GT2 family glycosyltransferase